MHVCAQQRVRQRACMPSNYLAKLHATQYAPSCCRHRRTYTDGGCYLKSGSEWSQESREGVISGYW